MNVGIQGIEGSFSEEAAKSYCKKFGIDYISNPFYLGAVDMLS